MIAIVQKKEKVVFDSAEFFMNKGAAAPNGAAAPVQPKPKNPLLPGQRKAPPPRVHVTTNTTETTWTDETSTLPPSHPHIVSSSVPMSILHVNG